MSGYDQWLAGLSPTHEESYQQALSAARQAAVVQRQVGTQVQCSALCTRLLVADMEIEVELGLALYMMPMVPRVL